MQEERNLLHTRVMPEINSRLREDGDYAQFLDFRWGIDTENLKEDVAMQKVLSTCFDGISNSSYVIVFIGDNYGTSVPYTIMNEICEKYEIGLFDVEKSITELEITFATEKDVIDKEKVIFYFKSNSGNDIDSRVTKLKNHIEELYPGQIRYYSGELDKHSTEFVDSLVSDIWELISLENNSISILDEISHNYALRWSSRYGLMEEISHSALKNPLTVISGESGSGKTVFMSALYEKIGEKAHTSILHVAKTVYNETAIKRDVWHLLGGELHSEYGQSPNSKWFGSDFDGSIYEQCNALRELPEAKPFVVLIDGIDKFNSIGDVTKTIDFINRFSNDVHFVVSLNNSNMYTFVEDTVFYQLKPLTEQEKISVINKELELYQKGIDKKSVDLLIAKRDSCYPLYLHLALKRLVMMQDEDYKKRDKEKNDYEFINTHIHDVNIDVGQIINNYIHKVIEDFSDDLKFLIVDYFEFAIKVIDDRNFSLNIASFMSSSFFGFTDTEILLLIDKVGFF